MEWLPTGVTVVLAIALVTRAVTAGADEPALAHLTEVRLTMLLLAAGVGFALDDPSEATVASAPVSRARRRAVRLLLAGVPWLLGWVAVLVLVATAGGSLPVTALSVEAAAWFALSLAAAGVVGGTAAGPTLLVGFMLAVRLPDRWALVTTPGGETGAASQGRWLIVLGAAMAVVVWSGLDPARRRHRRHAPAR